MQNLTFKDNSFVLENCIKYNISIQVSLDGFFFLIYNPDNQHVVYFNEYKYSLSNEALIPRKCSELRDSEIVLRQKFNKCSIHLTSSRISITPAYLFSEKLAKIDGGHDDVAIRKNKIISQHIAGLNAEFSFYANPKIIDFFNEYFPGCTIIHELLPLIYLGINIRVENSTRIHIHIHTSYFFILCFNNNELIYYNSFSYFSENDLGYFSVSVVNMLNMRSAEILCSGYITNDDKNHRMLKNFLPKAKIYPPITLQMPLSCPGNFGFQKYLSILNPLV